MKTVAYVVGGCGFVGTRLVDALAARGARVGIVDPCTPAQTLGSPVHVQDLVSATSLAALRKAIGPATHVFHLGGSGSVGAAALDADEDRRRTVETTRVLLEHTQGRFVLVSSAAVYGEGANGTIEERHACAPISVYGRHKLEAETIVRASGRPHAIVRFFSLYGPGLRKQLLWDACHKLRRDEKTFAGTGAELRDFLHVDDAVALLERVATAPANLVVNGGTGLGTRVDQLLALLQRALGREGTLAFTRTARPGDPSSLVASIARARELGWSPGIDVRRGAEEYARWFELQSC